MVKTRRQALVAMGAATGAATILGPLAFGAFANSGSCNELPTTTPSALPWPWKKLDPMEAGQRAFNYYHEKGG